MKLTLVVGSLTVALAGALTLARGTAPARSTPPATAAADTYQIDPVHSGAVFRVEHMGVGAFWGRFNQISGQYVLDVAKPEGCSIEIEIVAASVDTNNDDRDKHIKSPDFFNAEEFPTIRFTSKKITGTGDKTYQVVGELDFHGVKKEVTAAAKLIGHSETQRGTKSGFEAKLTIQRGDFDVKTAPGALGEEVELVVFVEGNKK